MNAVSLGNLVEQVSQVFFLNGQYALLQCLAVAAAKAAGHTNPPHAICSIEEGLKRWAIQHRLRYGSLVVSWPWQQGQLRIWHPTHGIPEWAHCDLAVCDRFYACVSPTASALAPAGPAGPRCTSADHTVRNKEWVLIREGHCLKTVHGTSSLPAPSPLELQRLRDAAASDLLAEIITRQGVNCFEGASGRSRSAQPVIFVPQESRLASASPIPAPAGIPALAAVAAPKAAVALPAQVAELAPPSPAVAAEVSAVPKALQQAAGVSGQSPANTGGPSASALPPPPQAVVRVPASKSRPSSRPPSR